MAQHSFFGQSNRNFFRMGLIAAIILIQPNFFLYGQSLKEDVPFFDAVMGVMEPLKYSGTGEIIRPDAKLFVDFKNKTWTLRNAYHYGSDNQISLYEGNKGLCGSLSRFMYGKIKEIFPPNNYDIKFCKVKERGFFSTPQATHIILLITDKHTSREYLLDPSFKVYGNKKDFKQYYDFEVQNTESFLKYNISTDKSFDVDYATPLFIKKGYLVTFSVEPVDGQFDKDHFILALAATYRGESVSRYIFAIENNNGLLKIDKDEELIKKLTTPQKALLMIQRLFEWTMVIAADKTS